MSAAPTAFDYRPTAPTDQVRRHLALAPAEGWSSVLLLALMVALVGWSIDDARWVLGSRTLTNFLPWAGMLGVAWGFAVAKTGGGRLLAYLGGAVLGAAYLTLVVGAQLAPGASIGGMFQATSDSVVGAYLDLVVRGRATTLEVGHFLLVLGIICWGAGQFAGYSAYAHRRPVAAVVLPGSLLLANIALTVQDQYALMVVYSIAALLFLVRFHVAEHGVRLEVVAGVAPPLGRLELADADYVELTSLERWPEEILAKEARAAAARPQSAKQVLRHQLEAEDRVVFRYLDNPNGSLGDIAGILSEGRNVMGLMPHPERACEPLMGSSDGLVVFQSMVAAFAACRT